MHTACCNAASTYEVWLYTVEWPMATMVWSTAHGNSQKWPALGIDCHSLRCGEWHLALLLHPACNTLPQFELNTFLYTLPARQLVSSCLGYQIHRDTVLRCRTCQMHHLTYQAPSRGLRMDVWGSTGITCMSSNRKQGNSLLLLWLVTMVMLIIAMLSVTTWLPDLGLQVLGSSLTALWLDVQVLDSTCWYLAAVLAVLCQSIASMNKPGSAGTVTWNSCLQLLQQLNSPGTVWGGVVEGAVHSVRHSWETKSSLVGLIAWLGPLLWPLRSKLSLLSPYSKGIGVNSTYWWKDYRRIWKHL